MSSGSSEAIRDCRVRSPGEGRWPATPEGKRRTVGRTIPSRAIDLLDDPSQSSPKCWRPDSESWPTRASAIGSAPAVCCSASWQQRRQYDWLGPSSGSSGNASVDLPRPPRPWSRTRDRPAGVAPQPVPVASPTDEPGRQMSPGADLDVRCATSPASPPPAGAGRLRAKVRPTMIDDQRRPGEGYRWERRGTGSEIASGGSAPPARWTAKLVWCPSAIAAYSASSARVESSSTIGP